MNGTGNGSVVQFFRFTPDWLVGSARPEWNRGELDTRLRGVTNATPKETTHDHNRKS